MTRWQARPETMAEEMHEAGSPGWAAFMRQSGVVAGVLHAKLLDHVSADGMTPGRGRILEFGAGIGGIALDLAGRCGMPSDACDVNGAAMSYLAAELPGTRCRAVDAAPPLPYADDTFDALYAISVFPGLGEAEGLAWLAEFARILNPRAPRSSRSAALPPLRWRRRARGRAWTRQGLSRSTATPTLPEFSAMSCRSMRSTRASSQAGRTWWCCASGRCRGPGR